MGREVRKVPGDWQHPRDMKTHNPSTDTAKQIYLEVLEELAEKGDGWTCAMIWCRLEAQGMGNLESYAHPIYVEFAELFSPEGHEPGTAWWVTGDGMTYADKHEWRMTAMAFMVAILEAGDACATV